MNLKIKKYLMKEVNKTNIMTKLSEPTFSISRLNTPSVAAGAYH